MNVCDTNGFRPFHGVQPGIHEVTGDLTWGGPAAFGLGEQPAGDLQGSAKVSYR